MAERIRVARCDEIPNDKVKLVRFKGRDVAVFHRSGQFFALDNRCPHQGGPLGEGHFDGMSVVCPWHHWDFDLKTGKSRLGPDVCVRVFRVVIENDEVFLET